VTPTVYVPVVAPAVPSVIVAVVDPFTAGVTDAKLKLHVMFTFDGLHPSVTAELNPFNDVTTTVVVVLFPATVEVDAGFTPMLKSFTVIE
jgi:hypothetical protein